MSFQIYEDETNNFSKIHQNLIQNEQVYQIKLIELLSSNFNKRTTNLIKLMIKSHKELMILGNSHELNNWIHKTHELYNNFIQIYTFKNLIDLQIKRLMIPIERIDKFVKDLSLSIEFQKMFVKLQRDSKLKLNNEKNNLELNMISFNNVKNLNDFDIHEFGSFFNLNDVIKRDEFVLTFENNDKIDDFIDETVELFQLKDKTLAICSIETKGRSLLFPCLKLNEFELSIQNDFIILEQSNIKLTFSCSDQVQLTNWKEIIWNLHNFINNFKPSKGLGLYQTNLKKSTNLSSVKHDSLVLNPISPNLSNINHYFDKSLNLSELNNYLDKDIKPTRNPSSSIRPILKSNKSQLEIAKVDDDLDSAIPDVESIVDSPLIQHPGNLNLNGMLSSATVNNMDQTTNSTNNGTSNTTTNVNNNKLKKRKSIFAFLKKDEPNFEIVTKSSINKIKNTKNLTINTSSSSSSQSNVESNPITRIISNDSIIYQTINPTSIQLFIWRLNKWDSININSMVFHHYLPPSDSSAYLQINEETILSLDDSFNLTKTSSLDLQIKILSDCFLIRCSNSKTLELIETTIDKLTTSYSDDYDYDPYLSASNSQIFSDNPSNSTSMSSLSELMKPSFLLKNSSSSTISTLTPKRLTTPITPTGPNPTASSINELLLKSSIRIKLHKFDNDEEWIPVSMGKFNLYSNLINPDYSKFEITCSNNVNLITLVKNTNVVKIGKTGLKFQNLEINGDEIWYLLEFKNSLECLNVYELLNN